MDEKGKKIGNDGKNDGKLYVIKTKESNFNDANNKVKGAGLSKGEVKEAKEFVSKNSGNSTAFDENKNITDRFIEIEGNEQNRKDMVDIVNNDNAAGGEGASNNREYGGIISAEDGTVSGSLPGPVTNPKIGAGIEIDMTNAKTSFHSHPSGTITEGAGKMDPFGGNSSMGSSTITPYRQPPSQKDVSNASSNVRYVFGRGDGTVYIYNNQGVQATMPQSSFVKPK